MDKFTALLVEKNITRDDLLLILRSVKLNSGAEVDQNGEQNGYADGIRVMSDCGFRIYQHEEWGYFFGIDGAGYDFYSEHWIPLYKSRGLQWHDPAAEKAEEMRSKDCRIAKLGGRNVWVDKNGAFVEEVWHD